MTLLFRALTFVLLLAAMFGSSARADSLKPAPPRGGDPFAGILDPGTLAKAEGGRIPDIAGKRVAVILSSATEKHLEWCELASHGWTEATNARMRFFHGQGYMDRYTRLHHEAYDPKIVVASAVDPLLRKASSVQVIGSFAEFLKGGYDILAVMDITFVNTIPTASYYLGVKNYAGLHMHVYFVDRGNSLVGKIEVGETRKVHMPPTFMDDAIGMRTAVLASYQAAMDQLLGPDKPRMAQVAAPAPTAAIAQANAGKASVADRLKELDGLVKQGLVTPAEADEMRKKILAEL